MRTNVATYGRANAFWVIWIAPSTGRRVRQDILPHYRQQDKLYLTGLIAAGKYCAVIYRQYPPERMVEATRYF